MFIAVTVLFPCFAVAAIAASVARRRANFIFMQTMRRLFETIDAQHTRWIDAALAATVKWFAIFEYTIAHRRQTLFGFDFLNDRVRIITENELFQCIDDGHFGARFIECATTCKMQSVKNKMQLEFDAFRCVVISATEMFENEIFLVLCRYSLVFFLSISRQTAAIQSKVPRFA